ncbi:hypothetical protein GGD50_006645 [Rhizobium paranaense]|uniref:PRC-barrel domain-containing protein n=1 Tax=Rhizobium paranaense TaxID=1650438 RepID=A0A7W8XZ25_9HYPH|nr:hypothetical protein [Rhizobium paranaense]
MDHAIHVRLMPSELTPAVLKGATIYGADDRKIGTVDHIHGSGAGGSTVIDVGGFLGIGAKPSLFQFRISTSCGTKTVTSMPSQAGRRTN